MHVKDILEMVDKLIAEHGKTTVVQTTVVMF